MTCNISSIFASASLLESHWANEYGCLYDLSEQHILDCHSADCDNQKCISDVLNFALDNEIKT